MNEKWCSMLQYSTGRQTKNAAIACIYLFSSPIRMLESLSSTITKLAFESMGLAFVL